MNVSIGANSLLIIPAGFNPSTAFHSFSFNGMTEIAGMTLVVSAGQGFGGAGAINDPVNCQGSIIATASGYGKYVNLNNGLVLSGTGLVNLGLASSTSSGSTLTVNDSLSEMSGGTLIANNENIGSSGSGTFRQSAGSNTVNYLYLGNLVSDTGIYNLVGGTLAGANEYIGASGSGSFAQSGGTNSVSTALYVGSNAGASGSYNLSRRTPHHVTTPARRGFRQRELFAIRRNQLGDWTYCREQRGQQWKLCAQWRRTVIHKRGNHRLCRKRRLHANGRHQQRCWRPGACRRRACGRRNL